MDETTTAGGIPAPPQSLRNLVLEMGGDERLHLGPFQISADPEFGYVRVWAEGASAPVNLSPEGAVEIGSALMTAGRELLAQAS